MFFVYAAISVAALIVICVFAVSVCAFKYACARKGLRIPRVLTGRKKTETTWSRFSARVEEGVEWIKSQPTEEISIVSYDGLKLHAYYLPAENAKRTVLAMHGFRGSSFRDFSFMLKYYHENGCNLLLADQRSHGKSEGRYICFGVKERYDCKSWAEYLAGRSGSTPVYLNGVSMGASTVLMACGLELPGNVRGVIADCGFTSPKEIFRHVFKASFHIPIFPVMSVFSALCRLFAGFGVEEADTVSAMKSCGLPVLFAHGEKDGFVPCRMSRENFEACAARKDILLAKDAGHAGSFATDTEEYKNKIQELFDLCEDGSRPA